MTDSIVYHLRDCYNITVAEREILLQYQGRVCAVCGSPAINRELHVDHSHEDGLVRGMLCYSCNKRWMHDDPKLHRAMADYLESPPAIAALGERRYGFPGKIGTKRHRKELKKLRELGWIGKENGLTVLENARKTPKRDRHGRSIIVRI